MPQVITPVMADGQILQMAVAAFAQGLDVFQRGGGGRHVFAAHPAGHHTMHLAGYGFVDFVAGVRKFAHARV